MDEIVAAEAGLDARSRVVDAALRLLERDGAEALTTRAVAAAASIQAPTLYRLFGDKQGLVDAVAERGFEAYLQQKRADPPSADPVDGLRTGWDLHVGFGLANPAVYAAMYGHPRPGRHSPAASRALAMLQERMRSLALAGRLRVSERRAADMVHAAACGVVLTLLEEAKAERDHGLSAATREVIIAAVVRDAILPGEPAVVPVATTLRALLPRTEGLSAAERNLLGEWLDRLACSAPARG